MCVLLGRYSNPRRPREKVSDPWSNGAQRTPEGQNSNRKHVIGVAGASAGGGTNVFLLCLGVSLLAEAAIVGPRALSTGFRSQRAPNSPIAASPMQPGPAQRSPAASLDVAAHATARHQKPGVRGNGRAGSTPRPSASDRPVPPIGSSTAFSKRSQPEQPPATSGQVDAGVREAPRQESEPATAPSGAHPACHDGVNWLRLADDRRPDYPCGGSGGDLLRERERIAVVVPGPGEDDGGGTTAASAVKVNGSAMAGRQCRTSRPVTTGYWVLFAPSTTVTALAPRWRRHGDDVRRRWGGRPACEVLGRYRVSFTEDLFPNTLLAA